MFSFDLKQITTVTIELIFGWLILYTSMQRIDNDNKHTKKVPQIYEILITFLFNFIKRKLSVNLFLLKLLFVQL